MRRRNRPQLYQMRTNCRQSADGSGYHCRGSIPAGTADREGKCLSGEARKLTPKLQTIVELYLFDIC